MAYFETRPEELSELGKLVFEKVKEEYALNKNVPAERMQEYVKVLNQAHTDWLKARAAQDFGLLEETLTKVVAFQKEFIPYWQKKKNTVRCVIKSI